MKSSRLQSLMLPNPCPGPCLHVSNSRDTPHCSGPDPSAAASGPLAETLFFQPPRPLLLVLPSSAILKVPHLLPRPWIPAAWQTSPFRQQMASQASVPTSVPFPTLGGATTLLPALRIRNRIRWMLPGPQHPHTSSITKS